MAASAGAPAAPIDNPSWRALPWPDRAARGPLEPARGMLVLASMALAPVVVWSAYGLLPAVLRRRMDELSLSIYLLSALGALAFLLCLAAYRAQRQRRQLRLNESLRDAPPQDFVLYLRSFRRAGAVVVRNHAPRLAARRLLGNFWDVELALSLAMAPKLPVVAVGAGGHGLGAAKFGTDDAGWQALVIDLARRAQAVVILPDDRPGTLWELRQVLGDEALRAKTLLVMAPEQHGWWRRLRRLPTVADSWRRVQAALPPELALPDYDARGALLPSAAGRFVSRPLNDFRSTDVQEAVAQALSARVMDAAPAPPPRPIDDDWRALLDPVWPVAVLVSAICTEALMSMGAVTARPFAAHVFSLVWPSLACLLMYSAAFTASPRPAQAGGWSRLAAHRWLRLAHLPPVPRAAVDTIVAIAVVALLRELFYEPYKVPSAAMSPTLRVGDLIVVDRARYGFKLPFTPLRLTDGAPVARGDVIVFRYPRDPRIDYLMRVVALGGDEVAYVDQRLIVNGQAAERRSLGEWYDGDALRYQPLLAEMLDGREYRILTDPAYTPLYRRDAEFAHAGNCVHRDDGLLCRVPPGHVFVLGDNRDNASDSRFWGFVPERDIVGRVRWVWMNFSDFGRVGTEVR